MILFLITNYFIPVWVVSSVKQPNILFVLVDDMGWHDVGWHNPDILTPNLDYHAYNGIILNHSYALPLCSPSRSAILTGLYPLRTGMSVMTKPNTHYIRNRFADVADPLIHGVIYAFAANGLPTKFTLLPEKLKELGYSTHIIGKWHLGYCNDDYLPQSRGFDTSYYIAPSGLDYYTHQSPDRNDAACLFRNKNVITDQQGTYLTELFANEVKNVLNNRNSSTPFFMYFAPNAPHSPLQAPKKFHELYSGIANEARRNYSAMVSALDKSFGEVVQLLKDKGEYENTIIIFTSDNGGQVKSGGCNYPLRGSKTTLYEGGTRVPAFIHSPLLPNNGYVYDGFIHITDWFTTIVHLAGGSLDNSPKIDGLNVWDAIISNSTSPRKEIVYNVDSYNSTYSAAIRDERYKLIVGYAGLPNTVLTVGEVTGQLADGKGETADIIDEPSSPYYRLFDLKDDPYEQINLAQRLPWIVSELNLKLQHYLNESTNSIFQLHSPLGNPSNFGGKCGMNWCEAIVSP